MCTNVLVLLQEENEIADICSSFMGFCKMRM